MNLADKAQQGLKWSAIQKFGSQMASLIIFTILARLLQPSDFGLVAMANVIVGLVLVFVDQGFAAAIVQRENLEKDHLNSAFWTSVVLGLFFALIVFSSAELIAVWFDSPDLIPIIRVISVVFVLSSLSGVHAGILQREMKFKLLSVRTLVATLIAGVLSVACALGGMGVWSLVVYHITLAFVQTVVLWRTTEWRPDFRFSMNHFKDLLSFGANVVGFKLVGFLKMNSDKLVIGYFLGAVSLGYYTVAFRFLSAIIDLVTGVVSPVAYSVFSKMQGDTARLRSAFYKVIRLTSVITFPLFMGLMILAPEFVDIVLGSKWRKSAEILQVLSVVGFMECLFFYNPTIFWAKGKPSWSLFLQIASMVTNLIALLVAVNWGIMAVTWAYVIRAYLFSPLPLLMLKKILDLSIISYIKVIAVPACMAIIMGVAVYFFHNIGALQQIGEIFSISVVILFGASIYCGGLFFLDFEIIKELKRIITKVAS